MKVALIHDHLAQDGGAERVLKILAEIFPDAPIYTLLMDKKNIEQQYPGRQLHTSIIQKLPGGVSHYQWYLPFMPTAVEFFDLSSYDVVISDTSSFVKGVITSSHTLHICYCHTPTRYLWSDTHSYIKELRYNKYFKKIISLSLSKIRIWDRVAADRVDKYIANSKFIAQRIRKYYQHESTVIYPPVEVDRFKVSSRLGDYFLIGGRLAPYKRVDAVIEAFNKLYREVAERKYKLKIYGNGIDMKRLMKMAEGNGNIEFLGRVSDEEKAELYSNCLAFINPQEEDFGITAVEAMAAGRPVIAYRRGGATETVLEGKTGVFINEQTADALVSAVKDFQAENFDSDLIRKHAEKFSVARFKGEIIDFVNTRWEEFRKNI